LSTGFSENVFLRKAPPSQAIFLNKRLAKKECFLENSKIFYQLFLVQEWGNKPFLVPKIAKSQHNAQQHAHN